MKGIDDDNKSYRGPVQLKLNDDTHPVSDKFADSELEEELKAPSSGPAKVPVKVPVEEEKRLNPTPKPNPPK